MQLTDEQARSWPRVVERAGIATIVFVLSAVFGVGLLFLAFSWGMQPARPTWLGGVILLLAILWLPIVVIGYVLALIRIYARYGKPGSQSAVVLPTVTMALVGGILGVLLFPFLVGMMRSPGDMWLAKAAISGFLICGSVGALFGYGWARHRRGSSPDE